MSDSLNNKELVAVGHQFAKAMSSETPIMDIAKIVSRLAERLDCTTAALREMTKQRDADHAELQARCAGLAAENAGLNAFVDALLSIAWQGGSADGAEIQEMALKHGLLRHEVYSADEHENQVDDPSNFEEGDPVYFRVETPATDAFLAGRATVTLPTGYSVRLGHPISETERSVMIPKDDGQWLSRFDVEHALRVAGIRINRDE
ncbi:hypothetical protein ABKV49_17775 [Enterobacter ludwigii]|uniref:hypothetical protein n=1 Tax=Enterobacter ludwigii TaxID=299767 RepID=UPI0032B0201D